MASLAERAPVGTGMALAAVLGLAAACGGGSQLAQRDIAFPALNALAPDAQAVAGKQFGSAVTGKKLTWQDPREAVNFQTTLRYGEEGELSGSWKNPDAGTEGQISGSWKPAKQGVCLTYGGDGETCYKLYRSAGKLYLVGQGAKVFERAQLPSGVSLSG